MRLDAVLTGAELKKAEIDRDSIVLENEDEVGEYYELRQLLSENGADFCAVITHPTYALPFLNAGRLVEVREGDKDFGWGIVVGYNKIINPRVSGDINTFYMLTGGSKGRAPIFTDKDPPQKGYVVDVMVKIASGSSVPRDRSASSLNPPVNGDQGEVAIIGVLLSCLQSISQLRINLPKDLRQQAEKTTAFKAVAEINRRMPDGPTLLDPARNMGINDKSFKDLVKVGQRGLW